MNALLAWQFIKATGFDEYSMKATGNVGTRERRKTVSRDVWSERLLLTQPSMEIGEY